MPESQTESAEEFRDQPATCRNREKHGTTPSACPWCGYDPLAWRTSTPPASTPEEA